LIRPSFIRLRQNTPHITPRNFILMEALQEFLKFLIYMIPTLFATHIFSGETLNIR